jgi:CheY-like chemotaxis protein
LRASAAIERVKSLDPDLVVLDLTMPRLNGLLAMGTSRTSRPGRPSLSSPGMTMRRMSGS